jgi:superfamily I DNA/RNA helicase
VNNLRFLELSSEQQNLLLDLPFDGRFLISGPPGSGKTLLAVSRAIMLDIADRSVVLLTYSNVLRQYAESFASELGFRGRIMTCHKWFQDFWKRRYAEPPPRQSDGIALDWTEIILRFAKSPTSDGVEVEDLVVDEGQDLSTSFYALCRTLAANVTVFADENQRIGDDQSTLAEIRTLLGEATFYHQVSGNHRNTRQIAEFAFLYHCGAQASLPPRPLREGPPPTLTRHPSEDVFADALAAYAFEHPNFEIGVAVRTQRQLIALVDRLHTRGVRNVQTYASGSPHFREVTFSRPGIRVFSPVSMKGQEFDAVFLPNLELFTGDASSAALRMQLYVLATRARTELHLSYQPEREPEIVRDVSSRILRRMPHR